MSLAVYLGLAAWFFVVDCFAGEIAGSKPRRFMAAMFALAWPISTAVTIVLSAEIVRCYRVAAKESINE